MADMDRRLLTHKMGGQDKASGALPAKRSGEGQFCGNGVERGIDAGGEQAHTGCSGESDQSSVSDELNKDSIHRFHDLSTNSAITKTTARSIKNPGVPISKSSLSRSTDQVGLEVRKVGR